MNLATYLRRTGTTNAAFARKLGVPAPTVWRWAKRQRTPGVAAALRIERITGGEVPVTAWAKPAGR